MSLGLLRRFPALSWNRAAQWSYLLRLIGPCDDVHSHNLDVWHVWRHFYMNVLWESDEVMSFYIQKVKGQLHCDVIMSCDRFWRFWRLLTATADAGYSWLWMTCCQLIVWWAINSNIQPSVCFVFVIILFGLSELSDWLQSSTSSLSSFLFIVLEQKNQTIKQQRSHTNVQNKVQQMRLGIKERDELIYLDSVHLLQIK